jgi:hypothetical protein
MYVLQCRSGKRTAKAAVKCAVDMVGGWVEVVECIPWCDGLFFLDSIG